MYHEPDDRAKGRPYDAIRYAKIGVLSLMTTGANVTFRPHVGRVFYDARPNLKPVYMHTYSNWGQVKLDVYQAIATGTILN